jgi:membrane-bound inhibitor of C-type lysozyme
MQGGIQTGAVGEGIKAVSSYVDGVFVTWTCGEAAHLEGGYMSIS